MPEDQNLEDLSPTQRKFRDRALEKGWKVELDRYTYPYSGTTILTVTARKHETAIGMTAEVGKPRPRHTVMKHIFYYTRTPDSQTMTIRDAMFYLGF